MVPNRYPSSPPSPSPRSTNPATGRTTSPPTGKKIARVPQQETVIQLSGTGTAPDSFGYTLAAPSLAGYVFQAGDVLSVREKQSGSMDGGITIFATNGLNILGEPDQDGMPSDDDTLMDVWHNRTFSLAPP